MEKNSELPISRADPKLVIPLGRSTRGKTFFLRWAVERAQAQGRDIVVADADRTNMTLSAFFDNVVGPPSGDDRDVRQFLEMFIERQIEERFTAVLDLGGGDTVLKAVSRELRLVEFLCANGITPIVVHLIGAALDDLAYLQDVEKDAVLAPPCTILVLNESSVPAHRTAAFAFENTVGSHEILVAAIERGARLVRMPRLEPATEVDNGHLTFAAAEEGHFHDRQALGLGPWKRQQVAIWRRLMEASFASVESWLP